MTTPKPPHFHWTESDALNRARNAADLYTAHAAALAPVLDAGLVDAMNADRAALGDETALTALTGQKKATAGVHDVSADGHDLVSVVRDAVGHSSASSELRAAIGIGEQLSVDQPKKIAAALHDIVEHGAELAPFGVSAAIVAEATDLEAALHGKRDLQSGAFSKRHTTTDARSAAHLRIENAIKQISHRGALALRKDLVTRAQLRALIAHAHAATADASPAATPAGTPAKAPV